MIAHESISCSLRLRGHGTRDLETTKQRRIPEMTNRYKNLIAYRFSINDYGSYWHAAVFCRAYIYIYNIVRSRSKRISFPYWVLATTGATRRFDDKTTAIRGAWNIDNKYESRIIRHKSSGSTRYITERANLKNSMGKAISEFVSSWVLQRAHLTLSKKKREDTLPQLLCLRCKRDFAL